MELAQSNMVSIIIVHYKAVKELLDCLTSIYRSKPKTAFEIIVVDNDEEKKIKKTLLQKFPRVTYIESKTNRGYGAGNNLGARFAKGAYLFFLNPDTVLFPNTIDALVQYLQNHSTVGIVAPVLQNSDHRLFDRQGSSELTPIAAIFSLSFIFKYFPHNPIARSYLLLDWDKKTTKKVATVPGSAFLIRKKTFELIKGFDKRFFLFFEEDDLCRRVRKLGYDIVMLPKANLVHFIGRSMKGNVDTPRIFSRSRFLYFKKHFGVFNALLVETFLRLRIRTIF